MIPLRLPPPLLALALLVPAGCAVQHDPEPLVTDDDSSGDGDDDSADTDADRADSEPAAWAIEIPQPEAGRNRGILMFRGNERRDRHGIGDLPRELPQVMWRQTVGCSQEWCGVGWTGQPLLVDWSDEARAVQPFYDPGGPAIEAIVGGLDGWVHFVDMDTGEPSRKRFRAQTASIKGTMTVDPRGAPLLYVGQGLSGHDRNWHYRAYSLIHNRTLLDIPGNQREFDGVRYEPVRSWGGSDGNSVVLEQHDRLLLGGENGLLYRVDLGTDWGGQRIGLEPTVRPVAYHAVHPTYGDPTVLDGSSRWAPGIESSVALYDGVAYFADSVGSLIGIDHLTGDEVLRLDLGDDTDASPVISVEDGHPYLYIGTEVDKQVHRRPAMATGTLRFSKIDLVAGDFAWRLEIPAMTWKKVDQKHDFNGGVLATSAVGFGPTEHLVFVPTAHEPRIAEGRILAVHKTPDDDGNPIIAWSGKLHGPSWSSPALDGQTIVVGDSGGWIQAFDALTGEPLWELDLGGTVESSPVFWDGRIVVGVRGGALLCLAATP